jgi:hypothetical protein
MWILYPALPIAAVLAWFGPFANHALKMRVEKNYREMWGACSLALLPASIFWLIVVSGESSMVVRSALLIPAGAVVGACVFMWAGYIVHDMTAKAQQPGEAPPVASGDKPPVNITGSGNVVSIGQTGGVTAQTYINQVPQPELRLVEQKDEINPDGTHSTTFTVEVASQVTPAFLAIDIAAQGIIGASIMPPPAGGVAGIMLRNVRRSPTEYHAELTSPHGRYFVSIQTEGQTPIRLAYQF